VGRDEEGGVELKNSQGGVEGAERQNSITWGGSQKRKGGKGDRSSARGGRTEEVDVFSSNRKNSRVRFWGQKTAILGGIKIVRGGREGVLNHQGEG